MAHFINPVYPFFYYLDRLRTLRHTAIRMAPSPVHRKKNANTDLDSRDYQDVPYFACYHCQFSIADFRLNSKVMCCASNCEQCSAIAASWPSVSVACSVLLGAVADHVPYHQSDSSQPASDPLGSGLISSVCLLLSICLEFHIFLCHSQLISWWETCRWNPVLKLSEYFFFFFLNIGVDRNLLFETIFDPFFCCDMWRPHPQRKLPVPRIGKPSPYLCHLWKLQLGIGLLLHPWIITER